MVSDAQIDLIIDAVHKKQKQNIGNVDFDDEKYFDIICRSTLETYIELGFLPKEYKIPKWESCSFESIQGLFQI